MPNKIVPNTTSKTTIMMGGVSEACWKEQKDALDKCLAEVPLSYPLSFAALLNSLCNKNNTNEFLLELCALHPFIPFRLYEQIFSPGFLAISVTNNQYGRISNTGYDLHVCRWQ